MSNTNFCSPRTHWQRPILLVLAGLLYACNAENKNSALQLPLPEAIRQIAGLDGAQLSLEISINNGPVTVFNGQGLSNQWRISADAPAAQTNTIKVTWVETYQQQRLVLASQTHQFNTGNTTSTVTLSNNYVSTGSGYDQDSDGVSNLAERQNNTDPLNSDSGEQTINEPQVVSITGGCYLMGSPDTETGRQPAEVQHQVCVNDFQLGKFEVTFEQYDQFASLTNRAKPDDVGWGRGSLPVTNVSWFDAQAYTQWLRDQTGKQYRLPTEAEWEYAARANTTTPFSTGNSINPQQANYNASVSYNGSALGEQASQSVPVGSYPPNAFGLYDMHGNQSEWTCSTFAILYDGGELSCEQIVGNVGYAIRGGAWASPPATVRSAARARDTGDRRFYYTGFRVAVNP